MFPRAVFRALAKHSKNLYTVGSCFLRLETRRKYSAFGRENTIYALSSGYGKCGVAVIRISGSLTMEVMKKMTKGNKVPSPREATLATLVDHTTGQHLDNALVLWFPAPHSFTGEDVCEFHVHGGSAVIASVFRSLSSLPGLKHAEPGDYTRRAFLNGKLDLTEVEGLGDLIHAETEEQRKQALKQMEGRLKNVIEDWSKDLLNSLAHLEAYIDFGEDQHIDDTVVEDVTSKLTKLLKEIKSHLNDKRRGERLRNGVKLAIIGEPNVGKSSLLNLITARDAAIVSPIAGTTRDVVETAIDIDGFPMILSDTAGLRNTSDVVEIEGVRRAKVKASESDLILCMMDAKELISHADQCIKKISEERTSILKSLDGDQKVIYIINKIDLLDKKLNQEYVDMVRKFQHPYVLLSCETQQGFKQFMKVLSQEVKALCFSDQSSSFSPSLTQERHRAHVSNCLDDIENAITTIHTDVVIGCEYIRLAMGHLGKLTGKVSPEDVLDVIFKDFCIGK